MVISTLWCLWYVAVVATWTGVILYISKQESRVLKFWFAPNTDYLDKVTGAYEFFKELVKPDSFPRGNGVQHNSSLADTFIAKQ